MIIRTYSHRAREKLERAIGRRAQGYFSFWKEGDWREITDQEYELVKNIKGIKKSKLPEKSNRCIEWK